MKKKNKYELNYLQWLTGMPRDWCKTIHDLEIVEGNKLRFKMIARINTESWKMCYGSLT